MSISPNSPESRGESWLPVPLPDSENVTDITGLINFFEKPLKGLGTAVHVEFSAINFRRHKTHDVKVIKTDSMPSADEVPLDPHQMAIITALTPEELAQTPPMLRKFFNQLDITDTDEVRGFFVLHHYNYDIGDSNLNTHDVGFLLNESEIEKGRFGFMIKAMGAVNLTPDNTRPWGDIRVLPGEVKGGYTPEKEKEAYMAFRRLRGGLYNPFIARAYLEATLLVGNAILARKIKSEYFE